MLKAQLSSSNRDKSVREPVRQNNANNPPASKPKRDLDFPRKTPCLAVIPHPRAKSIQTKHEPEVITYTLDDQTSMTLTSTTPDNEDIEDNEETDNESTDTDETDDEDTIEPDDKSITSNQHRTQIQPYRINVILSTSYIAILEHFGTFQV
eukprot:7359140-Ditylum_brightwellii.AAC.1